MEMLKQLFTVADTWVAYLNGLVWGHFLMFVLVGTGIFLTLRMRFVQIRFFTHGWSLISGKWDNPEDHGEITHFQALSTALSATIGTGNIAGVATAIVSGGPGAVVWMWITAIFGMCSKFTCCLLAQRFRTIEPDGEVGGGPMYYIDRIQLIFQDDPAREGEEGPVKPAMNFHWLAFLFALFTAVASFGIGNMVQANSVAGPLYQYLVKLKMVTGTGEGFSLVKFGLGVVMAVLVGLVILGGVKRIAKVAEKIVPFMAGVYVICSLIILILNWDKIIPALTLIFSSAFLGVKPAAGGALGFTVAQAMRFGVARGLFSNEAGLGSAAIAHAPAKTKEPVREGLVAMLGPFIDTIVICTMTALIVVIAGQYTGGSSGAELTSTSFNALLPGYGEHVVSFGLMFFAFTTMVGWSYYGDRAVKFLCGKHGKTGVLVYRVVYVLLIPIGAAMPLQIVWNLSDIANGMMAFPNLIALIGLSGVVSGMLRDYEKRFPDMKPYT